MASIVVIVSFQESEVVMEMKRIMHNSEAEAVIELHGQAQEKGAFLVNDGMVCVCSIDSELGKINLRKTLFGVGVENGFADKMGFFASVDLC